MNKYFDNAATSWPKAPGVAEAVAASIREGKGNPGRSHGMNQNRVLFDVRESLARLTGASDSSRIVFGLNATQMINTALLGTIETGDRVITSSIEHNAVSRPLRYLERTRRIDLVIIPCSPEGFIDCRAIKAALSRKTKLVVINHSSNVTGAVNQLKPIGEMVKRHESLFMVDCAQTIGSEKIDVNRDHIDLLAGPGHKSVLGPSGTGFLCISERCKPAPLFFGGTGSRSEMDEQPDVFPDLYESGTQNIHGLAGLRAALDFILDEGAHPFIERKHAVAERVLEGIRSIPKLALIGPSTVENRTLAFSVQLPGKDIADLANRMYLNHGIITRTGLHCAPWAHRTARTFPEGTMRISPGIFHSDEDIDNMIAALEESARNC